MLQLQYRPPFVGRNSHHGNNTRRTRANTTAIIITITPTAINQRCISAALRRQNLDPVPAAKAALLSVYLRRAPASDI